MRTERPPAWQQATCQEARALVGATDPAVVETIKGWVNPSESAPALRVADAIPVTPAGWSGGFRGRPLSVRCRRASVTGVIKAPDPPLNDGVVTLRPAAEGDLPSIAAGLRDPEIVRWFGRADASAADVLSLNERRWAEGSPTMAICEADGACLGLVWVNAGVRDPSIGYVGYWLLPDARGRGLATRAVGLISRWARHGLGFEGLALHTEPANERSQRVALRAGFVRTGFLPGHGMVDGRPVDHVLFELPSEGD